MSSSLTYNVAANHPCPPEAGHDSTKHDDTDHEDEQIKATTK